MENGKQTTKEILETPKKKKTKIKYKHLSGWLKLSIIMGWILFAEIVIAFIYGLIIGLGL